MCSMWCVVQLIDHVRCTHGVDLFLLDVKVGVEEDS